MSIRSTRRSGSVTRLVAAIVLGSGGLAVPGVVVGQSLQGSTRSLDRQNRVAIQHDYTYIDTSAELRQFVEQGYLVRIQGNADFRIKEGVGFPYARPGVDLFLARLGAQYRTACGEQLVVTSLTRPRSRQPRNASPRSVHPTGMAVDLRRSNRSDCRAWLESVLLALEGKGVLEATRERRPPHYHIALFPTQYERYVETVQLAGTQESEYIVRRGDSLWEIARDHGTTVQDLRQANDLAGGRIYPGQILTLPGR